MTAEHRMGHLQCGNYQLEIVRIDFAQGMMVVWGLGLGPMRAYSGPVRIVGWDGIPFWGTEDDKDNEVSWAKVNHGQHLILPLVIGDPNLPAVKEMLDQAREEIKKAALPQIENT